MDIEPDKLIDIRNRIYATLDDEGVIDTILKDLIDLVDASGAFFNVIGGEVDNALFGDAIAHGLISPMLRQSNRSSVSRTPGATPMLSNSAYPLAGFVSAPTCAAPKL